MRFSKTGLNPARALGFRRSMKIFSKRRLAGSSPKRGAPYVPHPEERERSARVPKDGGLSELSTVLRDASLVRDWSPSDRPQDEVWRNWPVARLKRCFGAKGDIAIY